MRRTLAALRTTIDTVAVIPGMSRCCGLTATVSIVVRKADNVLRIPASALRFRPEGFDPSQRRRQGQESGTAAAAGPGGRPERTGGGAGRGGTGTGAGRAGGPGGAGGRAWGAGGGAGGDGSARPQLVFVLNEKGEPQAARVRLGISDGQFVEVREGLDEGARVVTGQQTNDAGRGAAAPRPGASPAASNPFNPRPQRRQR